MNIRSRPVSLALVGLFLWVTACTSYRQIEISEVPDHGKVRVTSVSVGSSVVRNPAIEADSIKGTVGDYDYAIPLAGVEQVEAVGTDEVGTVFTVLGVGVLALAVVVAIGCAVEGCSMNVRAF